MRGSGQSVERCVRVRRRNRRCSIYLVAALLISLSACALFAENQGRSSQILAYETKQLPQTATGAIRFMFDDFGGLSTETLLTNAVPWKVTVAALLLDSAASNGTTVQLANV